MNIKKKMVIKNFPVWATLLWKDGEEEWDKWEFMHYFSGELSIIPEEYIYIYDKWHKEMIEEGYKFAIFDFSKGTDFCNTPLFGYNHDCVKATFFVEGKN